MNRATPDTLRATGSVKRATLVTLRTTGSVKRATLGALLGLLLVALACGASGDDERSASVTDKAMGAPAPAGAPAPPVAPSASAAFEASADGGSSVADIPERMIVRTVTIGLVVDNIAGTVGDIAMLAEEMGGFVVSSQVQGDDELAQGFVSIRVPAERTDEALNRLRDMAVRVADESTRSQDVTEEFVDLQARLGNLERTEEQYLRLMDRANSVEDLLRVQRELTSTQGQIEQLKGRIQYLERTSATSLINVNVRPAASPDPLVQPGWSALETVKDAVRGLTSFAQGLANLLISVAVFAPVWGPIVAILAWLGWRWRRARARRRASGGPAAP